MESPMKQVKKMKAKRRANPVARAAMAKAALATALLGLALAISPGGAQAQAQDQGSGPGYYPSARHLSLIQKADQARQNGAYRRMSTFLRDALLEAPRDPLIQREAFRILDEAYQAVKPNRIPTEWELPAEVVSLKVIVSRRDRGGATYDLSVSGSASAPGLFKQLKLTRVPGEVVLDKAAGVGEFGEEPNFGETDPNKKVFYRLAAPRSREPIPGGLYELELELANGKAGKAWVILDDDLSSTASPVLHSPRPGGSLSAADPTIRFENFRSPQYQGYEQRGMYLEIGRPERPGSPYAPVWGLFLESPEVDHVTVGTHPEEQGPKTLEPGQYVLNVNVHERFKFGPVKVGRDSRTIFPFTVTR